MGIDQRAVTIGVLADADQGRVAVVHVAVRSDGLGARGVLVRHQVGTIGVLNQQNHDQTTQRPQAAHLRHGGGQEGDIHVNEVIGATIDQPDKIRARITQPRADPRADSRAGSR